jgi:hypothetical protein
MNLTSSYGRGRSSTALAGLLTLTTLAAACGGTSQPTAPTPVLATENFTGTVAVGGADSKRFTVSYADSASDASITVTSLTKVSDGTAVTTTIGVAFGTIAFDQSCAASANYTASAANLNQEYVAQGAFGPGPYCVRIYDAGTLTEPVNYAVTVKHY